MRSNEAARGRAWVGTVRPVCWGSPVARGPKGAVGGYTMTSQRRCTRQSSAFARPAAAHIYADSPVKRPPKPGRANARAVPPFWRRFLPPGVADRSAQIRVICAPARVVGRLRGQARRALHPRGGLRPCARLDIRPARHIVLPMTIDKEAGGGGAGDDDRRQAGMPDPAWSGRGEGPSPVEFRLDPASGVPTYLQLVQQVEHALRLGYLRPGDQLPRVRARLWWERSARSRCRSCPRCAGPCWAGWAPRTRRGWMRTGWWRCSRARCGISVTAAAGDRVGQPPRARTAVAAPAMTARRSWHERDREHWPGQALPPRLGAAGLHAGDPRRARGRAGRAERRWQDHAAAHVGRPDRADRGLRGRARR